MLEHGATGDGIHHAWMDQMERQGVKIASFTIEFDWTNTGRQIRNWRIASEHYFLDYDESQMISGANDLHSIHASGLATELESAAFARAKKYTWFEFPHQRNGTGYCQILLADNEWLPVTGAPWYGAYDPGMTPLMRAALIGNVSKMKQLIGAGADVNATTPAAFTALIYAAGNDNPDGLRMLLEAGAKVRKSGHGISALATAVVTNHPKNVALLLKAGADPNSRDSDGETLLSVALRTNAEIANLLQGAGAHN